MKMFSTTIWISNSSGDNVTLEEFKNLPQAKSPMGKLFLSLLDVDWDEEMRLSGTFRPDGGHHIWISCDLFHMSRGDNRTISFEEKNGIPTVDKIKKKIYESLSRRVSSIEESIQTLQEDRERLMDRGREMQIKMARKFFEDCEPPIKIEKEESYEYHIFFLEAGEQGRVFRLYLSGCYLPAVFLIDREIYLEQMVRRTFPDKSVLFHVGQKFN